MNNSDTLHLSGGDTEQDDPESGVGTPDADLKGALHEVSNALTVVLGWLDVAGAKIDLNEVKEAIVVARTHAKLGHSIARQAIGAKVHQGSSGERAAGDFAASALMAVRPQASRRGVQLLLEGETETTARIRSVSAALQILTNLLLNAIDFTPESEAVKLTVRSDDENVYFEIRDSGPGIDPRRARTLFTAPESTRSGGAGIGLRHSEALARIKGAELNLIQAQPHAAFELRWPLADAPSGARSSKAPPRRSLKDVRVLVLEDDEAVRSLIELALEARGAQVVAVSNAEEFRGLLGRKPIVDAALVDLSPIVDDVKGSLGLLKGTCPEAQLVLITGQPEGVPAEAEGQFAAWVRKPFEISEVVDTLGSVLSPA